MTSDRVIHALCEGFNDRDFIAQFLGETGWDAHRGKKMSTTFGKLAPGQFLFTRQQEGQLRELLLRECGGVGNIGRVAKGLHLQNATKPLAILMVDDLDVQVDPLDSEPEGQGPIDSHGVHRALLQLADLLEVERPRKSFCRLGGVPCAGVSWQSETRPNAAGLPTQQTLERLICSVFVESSAEFGEGVEKWLRHDPPLGESGPKAFAYSYFAKWLAPSTSTDFYRAVWREKSLRNALDKGVAGCGLADAIDFLLDTVEPGAAPEPRRA